MTDFYAIPASHKGFAGVPAGRYTGEDLSYRGKPEFSDRVYREVAQAWGVTQAQLKNLDTPTYELTIIGCKSQAFRDFKNNGDWAAPRTPRQVLQWWSEYLRT